jgi:hypothetical protein
LRNLIHRRNDAKEALDQENKKLYEAVLLYRRILVYLDYMSLPTRQIQLDLIDHIRFSLLHNRIINKDLLWKALLHTGPQITENRESLKIIHFIRHELQISLKEFFDFLQNQNWSLTEELIDLRERWLNQELTEEEEQVTSRRKVENLIQ